MHPLWTCVSREDTQNPSIRGIFQLTFFFLRIHNLLFPPVFFCHNMCLLGKQHVLSSFFCFRWPPGIDSMLGPVHALRLAIPLGSLLKSLNIGYIFQSFLSHFRGKSRTGILANYVMLNWVGKGALVNEYKLVQNVTFVLCGPGPSRI